MKTIANKAQKTFEASIRMLMIKEGKTFQEAQDIVLEVVKEFKKQTSVPEGYDFIFRQAWGLTINEEILHRVISTLRAEAYPPMSDYLDAKVKGDTEAEQAYLDACAAVKVKYPKFSF